MSTLYTCEDVEDVLRKVFYFVMRLTKLQKWSGWKIELIIRTIILKYFFKNLSSISTCSNLLDFRTNQVRWAEQSLLCPFYQ